MKTNYQNNNNKDLFLICAIFISLVLFCLMGVHMAQGAEINKNPYEEYKESDTIVYVFDTEERMYADNLILSYCHEIDSLCYAQGYEIDADSIDIENEQQMEEEAYRLLGDYFYAWRQRESKYAWEYDVFIARFCY